MRPRCVTTFNMACRTPPHILAVLAFVSIISLYSLSLVFKAQRYDVSDEGSTFVDEKIPVAQAPREPVYSSTVEPAADSVTPLPAAVPSAPTSTSRSLPVSHPKFPGVVACPSHGTLEGPIEGSDKKALQAAVLERMGLGDAKPLKPGQEGVCFSTRNARTTKTRKYSSDWVVRSWAASPTRA